MSTEQSTTEFSAHFETLQLDEKTLNRSHGATIVPDAVSYLAEPLNRLRTLPRLAVGEAKVGSSSYPDLTVKGTIGEGGMGLVRLATQIALDRDVAVKTLRASGDAAGPKLLQEAWVTGQLEHPNIIPIYTLGRDEDGVPLIVMKRIEGVSWLSVLRDPACAPREEPADLHWHLDILINVCDALRFAHSHEIIHRDIKPENVMIGQFGEVYLLDWGIAISVAENAPPTQLIPHRRNSKGMAGTPAYMAPEMTDHDASAQDQRTDVYLLGATLHEVLCGEPRHDGKNLFDVLRSAFESKEYAYGPDVPAELGAVANRAMAKNPADRYQSVEEFRQAVLEFIQHRASLKLAHAAQRLLVEIESLSFGLEDLAEERNQRAQELFTECRFAARQALEEWPGNELAAESLRACLIAMVRFSLQRDDALGARASLTELSDPPRELIEALRVLEAKLAAERDEFARLRRAEQELDLRIGSRSRSLFVMVIGVLWASSCFWSHYRYSVEPFEYETWRQVLIGLARSLGIAGAGLVLFRKRLFSNVANRRIIAMVGIALVGLAVVRVSARLHGLTMLAGLSMEVCIYGVVALATGVMTDRRIAFGGPVYFAVAFTTLFAPGMEYLVLGFAHLVFFGWLAWLWAPSRTRRAT